MPFGTFERRHGQGSWEWDMNSGQEPAVELRQKDRATFVLRRSFCYLVPDGYPDAGTVFVVPGEDRPTCSSTEETTQDGHKVVIPPNPTRGETDLASVPWFMWWLVATYGNHTRAVLLHDALYVDEGPPPVPRPTADRLLLTALREPGQKTGVFRHWLMWAAVSVFGTMGKLRGALFSAHVFAVWGLLAAALAWAWGPTIWSWGPAIWPDAAGPVPVVPAEVANAALVVVGGLVTASVLLFLLGGAWRAGVDNTGGWAFVLLFIGLIILGLLWLERPWSFELRWSPSSLLLATFALLLLGLPWGAMVDRSLWGWLWPTALIGLPIAMIPVVFIFMSVYLVRFIDVGAARVRARQKDENGNPIGYQKPDVKPTRFPI